MATTTVVTAHQVNQVLEDYKIHLTGDDTTTTTQGQTVAVASPPNWPTDYYRVPPFRPINRNLDFEQRTLGSNGFETAFLFIMFSGVSLNATIAKAWGATGGPFFPGLFRYAIGGEW